MPDKIRICTNSKWLKVLTALILILSSISTNAQYFQQEVKYHIKASLDTTHHTIVASCVIDYQNNAPRTLDTLFFHLWANAFADKNTSFAKQRIDLGLPDFYFFKPVEMGGYSQINCRVDDKQLTLNTYQKNPDIAFLILPKPLQSGEKITLSWDYTLQLPHFISRMGYDPKNQDYHIKYWYPTPGVYDLEGWHPMPYLSMGESYSEVGDYDIEISIPGYKIIGSTPPTHISGDTYYFSAAGIPDFALIATHQPHTKYNTGGLEVHIVSKSDERKKIIKNTIDNALPYFENIIGKFPFSALSIFDRGQDCSRGGMEYPGLITISGEKENDIIYYTIHEFVHQYFFASLVTNQRDHPWMDEGLATYYQKRYFREVLGFDYYSKKNKYSQKLKRPYLTDLAIIQAQRHKHQSLDTKIGDLSKYNYLLNSYEVPSVYFELMQEYLGKKTFDQALKTYYMQWSAKHPSPENLQDALQNTSDKDLTWFFEDILHGDWSYDYSLKKNKNKRYVVSHISGSTPPYQITAWTPDGKDTTFWIKGHSEKREVHNDGNNFSRVAIDDNKKYLDVKYQNNASTRKKITLNPAHVVDGTVGVFPSVNYNTSDGFQLGLSCTNTVRQANRFRYRITPGYGFRSGSIVGNGKVEYHKYLNTPRFHELVFSLEGKRYDYTLTKGLVYFEKDGLLYNRLAPRVTLVFNTPKKSFSYRSLFLEAVNINREIRLWGAVDNNVIIHDKSTLFRLGFLHKHKDGLGAFDGSLVIEYYPYKNLLGQSHSYTKITGSIDKNYMYSTSQSIHFRLWGGYFLTNTQRQSSSYDLDLVRGSLSLIYQGHNDYAFDHPFFNRYDPNSILINQISTKRGGFKTAIPHSYRLGLSNDLALSANIVGDLPVRLPKWLPLRIFFDAGYYTAKGASQDPLKGKIIYSGGVELSFLKENFRVYLPLFNSKNINDIYASEGYDLLKKISFSIDFEAFDPWRYIDGKEELTIP